MLTMRIDKRVHELGIQIQCTKILIGIQDKASITWRMLAKLLVYGFIDIP